MSSVQLAIMLIAVLSSHCLLISNSSCCPHESTRNTWEQTQNTVYKSWAVNAITGYVRVENGYCSSSSWWSWHHDQRKGSKELRRVIVSSFPVNDFLSILFHWTLSLVTPLSFRLCTVYEGIHGVAEKHCPKQSQRQFESTTRNCFFGNTANDCRELNSVEPD